MSHIPKFRKTNRLVSYVQNNLIKQRLAPDREEIFFTSKEEPHTIATNVASYAVLVGKLDERLENLLKSPTGEHGWTGFSPIMKYAGALKRHGIVNLPSHLEECLKGHDSEMFRYAKDILYGRLPEYLENTFTAPTVSVQYAAFVASRKGGSFRFNPELEEKIFNSEDEGTRTLIAECLVKYSRECSNLLEEPLLSRLKWNSSALVTYAKNTRGRTDIPQHLIDSLAGSSRLLLDMAQNYFRDRLPEHLERTISEPAVCMEYCPFFKGERLPSYLEEVLSKNAELLVKYAKEVVRGRLPEHIEESLMGNHVMASRYAFEVIRGFAPVRLPEALHNMMMMMSYSNPDDPYIKRYTDACDSDPNRMKNSAAGFASSR